MRFSLLIIAVAGALLTQACAVKPTRETVPSFTVAFAGDTGYDPNNTPDLDSGFERVLDLVKKERAALLVIPGDFGYEEKKNVAAAYFRNIDRILGDDFPVLGTDGNHDDWSHYRPYFQERLFRMKLDSSVLSGDEYAVTFGGVRFIALGERGHADLVRRSVTPADAWRVCTWHKNMADMQTGDKGNDMDWATYRACQDLGAIIATAHEHSYERTRTLTDLGNPANGYGVTGKYDQVDVGPGRTFAFVSGLGGRSRRDFDCLKHDDDSWWATIFTSNYYLNNGRQVARSCDQTSKEAYEVVRPYTDGVLFLTFNAGGDPNRATGYFKTVDGRIIDSFQILKTKS